MTNQTGTLTSSQGSAFIGTTPNDTITFNPTGTYTVEYPLGTIAISGSSSIQSLAVSGGQLRLTCVTGSVAWSLVDGADSGAITSAQTVILKAQADATLNTGYRLTAHGTQIDFANTASVTLATWTGGTGTLTLTREVTHESRPTLRVDMPAACTRVELGVTSGITVPSSWDTGSGRTFGMPLYIVDRTPLGTVQLYVGDSTYTNYDLLTVDVNASQAWNGWHVIGYRDSMQGELPPSSKTGPVLAANVSQAKMRINKTAGTAATLYLSWGGTMPVESAKIMWTADDGYDEWYSWLMPQATLYGIPWALGFDRYYVQNGIANFMTEAQVRSMAADTSGLFEMYPHGYNNTGNTNVGYAQYLTNDDATWQWLKGLGVRNDRNYHPYVKGQYDENTVAGMKARGVGLCRTVTGYTTLGRTYKTSLANTQQADSNLRLPIGLSLESGYTLANGKTAIDNAIATGGTLVIMAHEFVDAGATGLQWTKADTLALMEYAAAKERAGLCENIKASELAAQNLTAA